MPLVLEVPYGIGVEGLLAAGHSLPLGDIMNMYELWDIQNSGRSNKKEEPKVEMRIPIAIPVSKTPQKKRGRPKKNAK